MKADKLERIVEVRKAQCRKNKDTRIVEKRNNDVKRMRHVIQYCCVIVGDGRMLERLGLMSITNNSTMSEECYTYAVIKVKHSSRMQANDQTNAPITSFLRQTLPKAQSPEGFS